MQTLDKEKFAAFLAELRKEKGLTQRQLAEQLSVSDKAVSKWETAVSMPDVSLLLPLAEVLGVSVTELLIGERRREPMEAGEVETLLRSAIRYVEGTAPRAMQENNRWKWIYLAAILFGIAGHILYPYAMSSMPTFMAAIFGAYFCFFVPLRLPRYHDENRIGGVQLGGFRMNLPGVAFNNSNWPHIVTVCRIWSCSALGLLPLLGVLIPILRSERFLLVVLLGGLFVPVWLVARKYE